MTESKLQVSQILQDNLAIMSEEERALILDLIQLDQHLIFDNWDIIGINDNKKKKLLLQLINLNIITGSLRKYITTSQKLLYESKVGINPFDGYIPSIPNGICLDVNKDDFNYYSNLGYEQCHKLAFVLVAGGLGERLGYNGIKIELPIEITTEICFLKYYCSYILEIQKRGQLYQLQNNEAITLLPLAIMLSDDTHIATVNLLEENNYFGLNKDQIYILKQEKVPAIMDSDSHLALDINDSYSIMTKPHGHGDIHSLLAKNDLIKQWINNNGTEWIFFFQDTNALVFNGLLPTLGVSISNSYHVNIITVPRGAKEAVGGICKMENKENGSTMTVNVEYNQLDPLLRSTISPEGDIADLRTGNSPYPGNTNSMLFHAKNYNAMLSKTHGEMPEFINPKYIDENKLKFKKPTRVECMMQGGTNSNAVGFTQFERWYSYNPVKNSIQGGITSANKSGYANSASSAEAKIYECNRKLLDICCKHRPCYMPIIEKNFSGIKVNYGCRVVIHPSFGITLNEMKSHFSPSASFSLSTNSTLVIEGDINFHDKLTLDGALILKALDGVKTEIGCESYINDGWHFENINPEDIQLEEKYRIRGYHLRKLNAEEKFWQ